MKSLFLYRFIFCLPAAPPKVITETRILLSKPVEAISKLNYMPNRLLQTVAAFLRYIDSGYFNKAVFYRILTDDNQPSNAPKSELIQGGIWKTNYKLVHALPGIPHESTKQTGILHKDGTISPGKGRTRNGQYGVFICVGDQPVLIMAAQIMQTALVTLHSAK